MVAQVKKIGNSKGIVIPAQFLKLMGIHENDELTIDFDGRSIKLTKKEVFNPQSLDELFSAFDEAFKSDIVFHDTEGREVW